MPDQVEVQQRIADNIRVWAKIRKVTLKSLQSELGMKKGPFFERLRGKTAMTITELARIAELLNVGVADLLAPPGAWVAGESNPEPADIGASDPAPAVGHGRSVKTGSKSSAAA